MARSLAEIRELVASVPVWHQSYEIAPGVKTPGSYDPMFLFDEMALPSLLTVSGFSTSAHLVVFLAAQKRGASVVALDYRPKDRHGSA